MLPKTQGVGAAQTEERFSPPVPGFVGQQTVHTRKVKVFALWGDEPSALAVAADDETRTGALEGLCNAGDAPQVAQTETVMHEEQDPALGCPYVRPTIPANVVHHSVPSIGLGP